MHYNHVLPLVYYVWPTIEGQIAGMVSIPNFLLSMSHPETSLASKSNLSNQCYTIVFYSEWDQTLGT